MNFYEFQLKIKNWATERGIYRHSTSTAQLLKGISEMGELADAQVKGNEDDKIDAVGDILVCLVNYCALEGFTMDEAWEAAWNQIKDRKGHMVAGGAFIKDE